MIGLGSYAFFWHLWDGNPGRIDLHEALRRTREHGVDLFQICDHPPLERMSEAELVAVGATAEDLGITLEIGTKGVEPDHLQRFLRLADTLGARLVRSMVFSGVSRPALIDAERFLRDAVPRYADAGVDLALETYEQLPTTELVALVETVAHPALGICLDPANCVAALEHPREVVERCAPSVKNVHVKDFRFTRRTGWVGFALEGAPLGEGLLDYAHLEATVRPEDRGINRIVEHWVPLGDSLEDALALEDDWTTRNLQYLRRTS